MGRVNDFVVNKALDDMLEWRAAAFHAPVAINIFAPSMATFDCPPRSPRRCPSAAWMRVS
jgi:hypothetical protein